MYGTYIVYVKYAKINSAVFVTGLKYNEKLQINLILFCMSDRLRN